MSVAPAVPRIPARRRKNPHHPARLHRGKAKSHSASHRHPPPVPGGQIPGSVVVAAAGTWPSRRDAVKADSAAMRATDGSAETAAGGRDVVAGQAAAARLTGGPAMRRSPGWRSARHSTVPAARPARAWCRGTGGVAGPAAGLEQRPPPRRAAKLAACSQGQRMPPVLRRILEPDTADVAGIHRDRPLARVRAAVRTLCGPGNHSARAAPIACFPSRKHPGPVRQRSWGCGRPADRSCSRTGGAGTGRIRRSC